MEKRRYLFILVMAIMLLLTPVHVDAASPKLNKTNITTNVKQNYQLKMKNSDKKIKWSSTNKKVTKVSSKGKVTGVKKGTANIKAVVSGKTYKCKVTVIKASLNKTIHTANVGSSFSLKVKGTNKKVTWKSSNTSIATVSKNGKVNCKSVGATKITATIGQAKLTCTVYVINKSNNQNNNNNGSQNNGVTQPFDTPTTPQSPAEPQPSQEEIEKQTLIDTLKSSIATAKTLSNTDKKYTFYSFKVYTENITKAESYIATVTAATASKDTLQAYINALALSSLEESVPNTLVYYPTVSKAVFDQINEYRVSKGLCPFIWNENVLKTSRLQAGWNCINFRWTAERYDEEGSWGTHGNTQYGDHDLNDLASHTAMNIGYALGGGSVRTAYSEAQMVAWTMEDMTGTWGACQSWVGSPLHRPTIELEFIDTIPAENYFGAVAVYSGNYDDGSTYYSVIFSTNAVDCEYSVWEDGTQFSSNCPEEYKETVLNCLVYDGIEGN